jgi:formate hydrogenlyase subunit 3/multisubunit Na+/H+ antiporter MnhD subunit
MFQNFKENVTAIALLALGGIIAFFMLVKFLFMTVKGKFERSKDDQDARFTSGCVFLLCIVISFTVLLGWYFT